MARDDETRLFRPDDLLSRDELAADAEGARSPAAVERDEDLDAAHMWISKDDGLLVRGVKPHSAQKSTLVSRGIDTVSSAMSGKWFAVKHGVQYVELYSGPGRLLDESTGVEQAGSPIRALSVRKPFTHYVLSDFSQGCVDALSTRVGERTDVDIVHGDANDPGHLKRVADLLNPRALIVAYLDPARPQDLRWTTVEYLATKFGFIDLIINLPLNSLMRAILGAYRG
jgi:three-Cys-motif partner protein